MKKFLPYILILTIFIGTFAPFEKVFASQANPYEECNTDQTNKPCTPYFCWDNDGNVYRSGIGADICYNAGYRWGSIEQYGTGSSKYNPKPGVLAEEKPTDSASCGIKTGWSFGGCLAMILARIVWILMKIASFILGLAGMLLNFVINITVVQMADNMSGMTGINVAWKIIRDVMNIGFIFLLVFQGVKLIISQDDIGSIKNFIFGIVLASLLINFSLFFTRVIIDSSNIITIGLYNSIIGAPDGQSTGAGWGLSNSVMQSLGIQSFLSLEGIEMVGNDNEYAKLVSNLMATVLFLITAFVFLAVSAMFVVRYIVLIFLLTLSPVAYMGLAFKDLKATASQWWSTLMGQIIFAPLFMLMMLVTLTLIAGNVTMATQAGSVIGANVESLQGGALQQTLNTLFNYVIIIGFMIASLVTAKKYSAQGNSYVSKMSGWANSKATQFGGAALFGGGGALGRRFIGQKALGDKSIEELEAEVAKGGVGALKAKSRLALARGSYDFRNAPGVRAGAGSAGIDVGRGTEGIPFMGNAKAGEGGRAAKLSENKKKMESDMDAVMKSYVDKKDWSGLADYIKNGKPATMSDTEWIKRQQYIYKKLDDRSKVSVENILTNNGTTPNALVDTLRAKMPIDDRINIYKNRKDWGGLATYITTGTVGGSPDQQSYVYEKLSPRDRVELEGALRSTGAAGGSLADKLRDGLSAEEKDKTKEQAKKAKTANENQARLDNIESIIAGRPLPAGSTATLASEVKALSPKRASELPEAALNNQEVVENLSNQHLKDIIENGEYSDTTKQYILSIANNPTAVHAMAAAQRKYFSQDGNKIAWGIV